MRHRDRVLMSLEHKKPDRTPLQISFTPEFAERLKKEMGLGEDDSHNPHGGGNTYLLERELDQDMLLVSVGWANSYYQEGYADKDFYVDEWEVKWEVVEYRTKYGVGHYTDIVGHPLADEDKIESYEGPNPARPELYREAERVVRNFGNQYFIVGVTVTTIFECAWALRGLEQLLMDFLERPELADQILDIPYRYHLAAARELVRLGVDMIWLGDDMGTQNSMLISPALWRRFFRPRMANFIAELRKINPEIRIAYHSDGNIYPIIPDLIEIGLDVLNPVQPRAMDPLWLKKEFGDRLCFWGTIDEQHTLPFGSPEEVRQEVEERIRTVGKEGGLILSPTHHVQLDTPLENFRALVESVTGKSLMEEYNF